MEMVSSSATIGLADCSEDDMLGFRCTSVHHFSENQRGLAQLAGPKIKIKRKVLQEIDCLGRAAEKKF